MARFAERTGLGSERSSRRYLWTDAFAVCNFLALARATGEERYLGLALDLVDQVHHVLGRHRVDDARQGWISGLGEQEGAAHPTVGGLRIGKELPERAAGEPLDEQLEWDRDGQYFHYLTKWMHALDQVARWTGQPRFNVWARELAASAHEAFVRGSPGHGGRGVVWKMSIDLSRPLVSAMGSHDPLDGFITCIELRATAAMTSASASAGSTLDEVVADFATMLEARDWLTADPLGLGGLLMDACRFAQLKRLGACADIDLLDPLLTVVIAGLSRYRELGEQRRSASHRLAFRELGLAIGLSAIGIVQQAVEAAPRDYSFGARTASVLEAVAGHASLGTAIGSFWREPEHQRSAAWAAHRDINEVMLATYLAPDGFLRMLPEGQPV